MKRNTKVWAGAIAAIFFGIWLGIPMANKWRADRLVDELCSKDGGIRVYEQVTLPKERFNNLGQPQIPDKDSAKSTDEYFSTWVGNDIRGLRNKGPYGALVIFRGESTYFRKSDKKILGQIVTYARRGGDPIGPWHPSHYSCPNHTNLLNKIFVKSAGK
jgi:hypothetical protein